MSSPAAVLACARALGAPADATLPATARPRHDPTSTDPSRLRAAGDALVLAQRFPPPADPGGALGTLLFRLRGAALLQRSYPGIAANQLAAARHLPAWAEALTHVAWATLNANAPPGGVWANRLGDGLHGHWLALRRHRDAVDAYAAALERLLPLLRQRLAAHGIDAERALAAILPEDARALPGAPTGPDTPHEHPDGIPNAPPPAQPPGPRSDYRVWSRAFDQVLDARRLVPTADLPALRAALDAQRAALPPVARRIAARLRRELQARARREWAFELEEGRIDGARLAPFVAASRQRGQRADGDAARIFSAERAPSIDGAIVTLLIDRSGSMRGRPMATAAACVDLLGEALSLCGVRVEVLGYSTRYADGGPLRAQWRARGAPATPGRLNATRHLIYKTADTPWQRARNGLAALLHAASMRENIDGEALLWAHARLLARPEARRVLVVISDGAPLDSATREANGRAYLSAHLHDAVRWIDAHSPVTLRAIGIGHDVHRHYPQAVTIADPDALAETLLSEVAATLLAEHP